MSTHPCLSPHFHFPVHPIPAKLKLPGVWNYVVIAAIATLFVLAEPNPAQQASQQAPTGSKPTPDLLRAVEKGDVKKIKALASQGVDLNFANPVIDIDDLQATPGGYSYKFKTDAPLGGSELMLTAIRSARPESVRTLVDLGVNIKTEFFIDADLGVPVPPAVFANALRYGLSTTVGGAVAVRTAGDHVVSSIRPTPATKTTYLGVAQQLLSASKDGKSQRNLQEIVNTLRQAGVREVPAGVSAPEKKDVPIASSRPEIHAAARDGDLTNVEAL